MSRFFEIISVEEFKIKLEKAVLSNKEFMENYYDKDEQQILDRNIARTFQCGGLSSKIKSDISKIDFDFENCEASEDCGWTNAPKGILGFHTLPNGMVYLGVGAGGDWEQPVYFIIYWSGKDLRGYVPTDGNTYNLATKTAYGSETDEDDEVEEEDQRRIDEAAMLTDIQTRIVAK